MRFRGHPGALLYTYILKFRIALRAPLPQAERPDLAPRRCRPASNFDFQLAVLTSPITAKRITAPMTALIIFAPMPPMKTNPIHGKSQPQ